MLTGKKVYVSLAPSWAGVYDFSKEKMIAVLKKLGFAGVSETALGAQEVSIQTAKKLNEVDAGLYISSACPVIDDYIRCYRPEFAKYITPIASPALTHCGLLKDKLGDDIKVVFIGPCIAKKNEADKHPDLMAAALTFDELNYWIKEEFIDIEKIEANSTYQFVPEAAYEGSLYPIEGGMNETIKQVGIKNNDVTFIAISSLEDFDKALQNIDPTKVENKIFVEALACSGGCINGPSLASEKSKILITSDIYANIQYREEIPTEPRKVVPVEYVPDPVQKTEYTMEQVTKALKKISKHTIEDELNCSGCGYASCREFVNALIAGDAEPSQCVSYMRKIAVRKAAAMLRCMPSAVVIVDSNMEIVEANDSFAHMFLTDEMYEIFASRPEGLAGACIDRIVSFPELFKSALDTGKEIHQEHYVIKNKVYDISIFTIEDNELIGAVISDVTRSEMDRTKIARRAREVITKNIATVQEIASLLGEHMVETELLLSSIAEDYDTSSGVDTDVH
ncbi:[bacterium]|nr:[Fe-S]-binding protein [bacterium]